MSALRRALRVIGPGIVFAGAAIGVSHLVQATRAGASFGLGLLGVVLLVHLLKYPALSFAPRYVAATGRSLLWAYQRQSRWALVAFGLVQAGTMFTIVAAVSMVTAAVLTLVVIEPLFGATPDLGIMTGVVLCLCLVLIQFGDYRMLERSVKALIAILGVCTMLATALVIPRILNEPDPARLSFIPDFRSAALLAFVVPLVGWMPAPLDISVWNSLWSVEQAKARGERCSRAEAGLDFNTGYALCALLAVCFLVLGAGLIYLQDVEPASGGIGLIRQTLALYTETLGAWARPVVGLAALAVMFSTTLTVLDALPRTMAETVRLIRTKPSSFDSPLTARLWLLALAIGGLLIVIGLRSQLGRLVDLATTLSFVSTPVIAWLNHRAMFSDEIPSDQRPSLAMRAASWLAIGVFSIAACGYIPWYFLYGPGS